LTGGGRVGAIPRVFVENTQLNHTASNRYLYSNSASGTRETIAADYFFSTMPVKELMRAPDAAVPANVLGVSDGLIYRDFITVGLLLKRLKIGDLTPGGARLLADNWIYLQEPAVQEQGRQIA
jgi:hypothetical protein